MSVSHVIRLGASKVVAVAPQGDCLDLRMRDRGSWSAASMDREQARALRDQIDAWLVSSRQPSAYERDLAALSPENPLVVWVAVPENCIEIDPDQLGHTVRVRTTVGHIGGVGLGDYIGVPVNGEGRIGRVGSIIQVDAPAPSGSPCQVVDLQIWLPSGTQDLIKEAVS